MLQKVIQSIMVDTARALLDELMGRNRNLDPTTAKSKKVQWDDPEVSHFNMDYVIIFQCPTNANEILFFFFCVAFSFVCIIW